MLTPDRVVLPFHESGSEWLRSFSLQAVKCLVVCRGPVRMEAFEVFDEVDLILAPVTPDVAFKRGELSADPVAMYQQDIFTIPASLAGLPALSIPCGFSAGMPLGLQLIGRHFGERELLQTAACFQRETQWHQQHPESA